MHKSVRTYDDARVNLDRALEAPKGIKIVCKSRGAAVHTRQRYNRFRELNRKENLVIYPPEHFMHGNSPYDNLVLSIPPKSSPEENVIYIALRDSEEVTVEEIPEKLSTENAK